MAEIFILMRGCRFDFNGAKMQNTEAKHRQKIAGTEQAVKTWIM